MNRPGLALAGFFTYFAMKRIQVLGSAEQSYLRSLDPEQARARCRALCAQSVPCLIISRSAKVPSCLLEEAESAGVAVFRTPVS